MSTILVVDDNEASRQLLIKILNSAGYEVIAAGNGQEALEIFRQQRPDLIITDMNMPVMNGYHLAEEIRQDPDAAHVPIIFISAMYMDTASKVKAMDIGGNEYLTQPLDRDEVLYKVKAMVRNKHLYDEVLRSREALKVSEQKYRALFNNATDAIYLIDTLTQQILDCNPKASEVTGYPPRELKAMSIVDLHPPSEQDIVAKIFRKMNKTGNFSGITGIHHLCKDGRIIPVEINATIFKLEDTTYSLGIFRDITERKKAEERLLSEKNRFLGILDTMQDGVYIVNQNYEIQYTNPAVRKTFGAVAGHKCYEYFHGDKEACPMCRNREIAAGHSARWEWASPGNGRVYDIIESPIRNPDGTLSKLAVLRDITDRKNAKGSPAGSRAEKRAYRRISPGSEYSARFDDSGNVNIKDLSPGGICLLSPRRLEKNSIYEIKLLSPGKKEITASGMVIRSSRHSSASGQNKSAHRHPTGFRFIGMNEADRDDFNKFIAEMTG